MKTKKRVLGMLLCVALSVSLFPQTGFKASAAESVASDEGSVTGPVHTEAVTAGNAAGDIVLEQTKVNETDLTVRVPDTVLADGLADELKVTAKMYYGDTVTQNVTKTFELVREGTDYSIDLENFGKFSVETEYLKGGQTVAVSETVTAGIVADAYNLAPISATFPAVLFSLSLWEGTSYCITRRADGTPVPTIALFERADSWDWGQLPENVYKLPTASESDFTGMTYGGQKWFDARAKMSAYIRDLYEISPDAEFTLYATDNYVDNILVLLTANHIPESRYHVVLLSDGSGTYSYFNKTFANDTDGSLYDSMRSSWAAMKEKVWEEMTYDTARQGMLSDYAAVAAADENVDWWVARTSGTFKISNTELLETVVANCTVKSVANMLTEVQAVGKDGDFQRLYHFDSDMFREAGETGKPVMLILGSLVTSEADFTAYAEMVMNYYGDSYVYYYKGHPATPTELYPQKQAELDGLGVTDVDSSIPAELILFYFPDIYMCGYSSTTFMSVESPQMACGVFNMDKETGLKQTYGGLMDFFASRTDSSSPVYGPLCAEGHDCYLLEFNDTEDYDIGIYDADDKTLQYYKNMSDEGYEWSPLVMVNAQIGAVPAWDYTGEEIKPDIVVQWNGTRLEAGTDYTVSYDNNIIPGQGRAVIRGTGDYAGFGSVIKYFVINKIDNPLCVSCQDTAYGEEIRPDIQNPAQGSLICEYKEQGADDESYTVTVPSEPGEYTLRVTGSYTDLYKETSVRADFAILKATPAIHALPEAAAVTEGQPLGESELSGGQADVEGSFSWKDSTVVPSAADSGRTAYTILFIPEDQAHYNTVEAEITLMVESRVPAETESPAPAETEPPAPATTEPPVPAATEPPAPAETEPPVPAATEPPAPETAGTVSLKAGKTITKGNNQYVVKAADKSGTISLKYAGTLKKKVKKVIIPAKIKYKGHSYKVTGIAGSALAKNKNLTQVTIGASVTQIGKKAFYNCKNLKKVTIKSKKVTKIKKKAFKGINKNAKFTLPAGYKKAYLKKIKNSGFKGK